MKYPVYKVRCGKCDKEHDLYNIDEINIIDCCKNEDMYLGPCYNQGDRIIGYYDQSGNNQHMSIGGISIKSNDLVPKNVMIESNELNKCIQKAFNKNTYKIKFDMPTKSVL